MILSLGIKYDEDCHNIIKANEKGFIQNPSLDKKENMAHFMRQIFELGKAYLWAFFAWLDLSINGFGKHSEKFYSLAFFRYQMMKNVFTNTQFNILFSDQIQCNFHKTI